MIIYIIVICNCNLFYYCLQTKECSMWGKVWAPTEREQFTFQPQRTTRSISSGWCLMFVHYNASVSKMSRLDLNFKNFWRFTDKKVEEWSWSFSRRRFVYRSQLHLRCLHRNGVKRTKTWWSGVMTFVRQPSSNHNQTSQGFDCCNPR